jgi:hypothetical protein
MLLVPRICRLQRKQSLTARVPVEIEKILFSPPNGRRLNTLPSLDHLLSFALDECLASIK